MPQHRKMEIGKTPILEFDNVSKISQTKGGLFGKPLPPVVALNRFSLKIYEGEIFGLVGESGSGKTTAGRLVVRLEDPTSGKIFLEGLEINRLKGNELKQYRRRIQMIFQDPYQSLNPQISIFDTVAEPLAIHNMGDRDQRRKMVAEMLSSVGLAPPENFFNRYPHQLSGGQRQRVAIARAMILNPTFVVADEPTSMLDASISAQIFNILINMREKLKVTLLFITHSLAAARYLCDRIGVIYKGNLVELGMADEVISRPKHPYTQALIDALPKFGQCSDVKRYGTLLPTEREISENIGCPFFIRCAVAHRVRCSQEYPQLVGTGPDHWVRCYYVTDRENGAQKGQECYYGT